MLNALLYTFILYHILFLIICDAFICVHCIVFYSSATEALINNNSSSSRGSMAPDILFYSPRKWMQYIECTAALFITSAGNWDSPDSENQFPNRDCQRGAILCETVPCDAVTSGFVSHLFTVRLDDKGQTMLVIYLQFTLSKKAKQSILIRSFFFQIVYKCIKCYI